MSIILDNISGLAAIISGLAALSAFRSSTKANESSNRANQISLFDQRVKFYKSFLEFKGELIRKGKGFSADSYYVFFDHYIISEFLFNDEINSALKVYNTTIFDIIGQRELVADYLNASDPNYDKANEKVIALMKSIRKQGESIERAIRLNLKGSIL
jgi:hypothetical protein